MSSRLLRARRFCSVTSFALVFLVSLALYHTTPEMTSTQHAASEPFAEGKQLSLIVDGKHALYNIKKAFLPFTKSVVVLAQPTTSGESGVAEDSASKSLVIVKIFDPRVLNDRTEAKPERPWTLAAELRAVQDRAREDFEWDDSVLYEDEPDADDIEGVAIRAAHWEQNFFHLTMQCYEAERAAYERLHDLQGTVLPRLLGVGHWDAGPAARAIQPPALVLEYVPSISLRDIAPELLDPAICTSLVTVVDRFATNGVIHTDFNDGNVLFSPPERPQRAIVIDFGCAIVREGDTSDEEWNETVQFEGDSTWVRHILKKKGVELPAL
ncbi:hypothetical protein DAEQUDRAFT_370067 [Daedalea quercina L-15889]|uniref:Aminoglycoside phosphotransferase domain-containing protein n=1 Tax=Daedalea quercina L-15889 TaxID=1314783 RepID=A0A165PB22_9APHY|nr:hypothetical protein DAEQUDRAFT_370067 [Daedalea quercina L-15889]